MPHYCPCTSLQGAVLDRHSTCCTSGNVDACGTCDGPAKAVDVQNTCCSSGVDDGDGYCCQSGLLDECGVCDGQSTACALHAVVDVQVRPSMTTSDLPWRQSHMQVKDLSWEGHMSWSISASALIRVSSMKDACAQSLRLS